jgi:hypothetical protein
VPTNTATNTPTITATATDTPIPCTTPAPITGSIINAVLVQDGRVTRDGVSSTCAVPKVGCPGNPYTGTPYHYDAYTFTNTTGVSQCVSVTLNSACGGVNEVMSEAYLGSYNPANVCANYLADLGSSPPPAGTYSFTVPAGATFVVVVNEINPGGGCTAYTLDVTGTCGLVRVPTP